MFDLNDYDFDLPPDLIAQVPIEPRDSSRLMVIDRASKKISHHRFLDLPDLLTENQLLVANDSKVIPARFLGHRDLGLPALGGKIEVFLLEGNTKNPLEWEALCKSSAAQVSGLKVLIPTPDGDLLRCELIRGAAESDHGTVQIRFDRDPLTSGAGLLPLPPYIERAPNSDDDRRYQTLHAEKDGSVAAPTAGLHFTPQIRESLRKRGVDWETLTLHVGMGTFRPVKCSDIRQHPMHKERTSISPETAGRLTAAKARGRKIVAVGTTSVRVLESAWDPQKAQFLSGENRTQLFIFPGGPSGFRVVDQMITNFHLPRSTLLMMVTAFAGRELIREAYAQAVKERYRFFSYGDAMVIL